MDVTEIAQTATAALDSAKSAHHRIDDLADKVNDISTLTTAMGRMDEKVDNLKDDVDEIKTDVKAITERPGKWWDKLIGAVIGAFGAGIVAAVLALILK
jgi:outer membrane murein-binding lipoprotein Lpp